MANYTTNYRLKKPLDTEYFDLNDFNNNADLIDVALKSNEDSITSYKIDNAKKFADIEYQTPVVVGMQIQLERQGTTKRLFFYMPADLTGGSITISLDAGATSVPLKDYDGSQLTSLNKGYVEVVDNTTFFTLAPKNGASKLNVYVQTAEPTKKEGIWINTSNSFSKVQNDTQLYFANGFVDQNLGLYADAPVGAAGIVVGALIGSKIYCGGGVANPEYNNLYTYDILTNTWAIECTTPFSNNYWSVNAVGTKLYCLLGTGIFWRYDTVAKSWTQLTTCPATLGNKFGFNAVIGDTIYYSGGFTGSVYNGANYKYNTTTGTWTSTSNGTGAYGSCAVIGTNIYLAGGKGTTTGYDQRFRKYDTLTDTLTSLTQCPYVADYSISFSVGSAFYVILITASAPTMRLYTYDFTGNTWSQVATYTPDTSAGTKFGIFYSGKLYANTNTTTKSMVVFSFDDKVFDENTVVLLRNAIMSGTYWTELVTPSKAIQGSINIRTASSFDNAWLYYNSKLQEYPTYYGDGTQWIKFKN